MLYHVSIFGSDDACGSAEAPFRTINRAAGIALPGDTVRVHGGVYREWVDPQNGGGGEDSRIVYEAAPGEHPIIKGSEIVTDWEHVEGSVYKKSVPNSLFGSFNPFLIRLAGDWLQRPDEYEIHLGDVYIDGKSAYEATDMDALRSPKVRESWFMHPLTPTTEYLLHPEDSVYQWRAELAGDNTVIYVNFFDKDPSSVTVEISVRESCFFPSKLGINYVTVKGFEMAHAATQLAPPTAEQRGMIGPNWAKGWIIEDNILHDSKCNAVSLGKEASTGNNYAWRFGRKSGHCHQLEAVFSGLRAGWSRDNIGSHIVRNNEIYDCGQTGIVGHMGCAFSRIEHNHIYSIGVKHEFMASEMAGIKFHAPIDVVIENNNIHNCTLGTWLDWQVQGTRITRNLYYANDRDFHIEVTHGPCTVDNNLFLSDFAMDNQAQGTAFVHNLFVGAVRRRREMTRVTPYHLPHSTEVAGAVPVYGGDDRVINNIVVGKFAPAEARFGNTANISESYEGHISAEEYARELSKNQSQIFNFRLRESIPQPVWIEGNAYGGYAGKFGEEIEATVCNELSASVEECSGEWILTLTLDASVSSAKCTPVNTERLGTPRITEERYENPDGTEIDFSLDYFGNLRGESVIPGPFASAGAGERKIKVWQRK